MALHPTQQFLRSIEHDPTKCILWVGAGLSASNVRKGKKGLPDWKVLMQHMIDDLRDSEGCDPDDLQILQAKLKQGKYLEVAQAYKQKTRPDQFAAFIKSELDPPDIVASTIHKTILEIRFRGIITTNFDRVFECQSDLLVPLVYPHCLDDVEGFRHHGFYAKIHGCVRYTPNPSENLVLTEESYRLLRSNPKYHTILRSCIVMHPILTTGFSLLDPDFLGLIDDLRESLGSSMPTIYSLMLDPGSKPKEQWLKQGVQIIPYKNHSELTEFFGQLLGLSQKRYPAPVVEAAPTLSKIDFEALLENWRRAQTVENAATLIQEQMDRLSGSVQKEDFLFKFLALLADEELMRLAPHLVDLGTKTADMALVRIFRKTEESKSFWRIKPHAQFQSLREWAKRHWQKFAEAGAAFTFGWLLDEGWNGKSSLKQVFDELLHSVRACKNPRRLSDLYSACSSIPGAQEAIEAIVLVPGFVAGKEGDKPWLLSDTQLTQATIRLEKFRMRVRSRAVQTPREIVLEAEQVDISRDENSYPDFTVCVAERLIEDFTHYSHLTIHGSSELYDPEKADEIVDAFASLKTKKCQIAVFWAFNHWPERMRGMISLREDLEALQRGLLQPLYWRFCSATRIDYFNSRKRPDPHGMSFETGQEFLLKDLMGLTYDIDLDFRKTFNASLATFKTSDEHQKYEPRALQELWRERDLDYTIVEDVPPELVRRIAVTRTDWNNMEAADVRWEEARRKAETVFDNGDLTQWISQERKDLVIDNLLGAYVPSKIRVILYQRMISHVAKHLRLEEEALSTIVFMHETVHAFSHIGRDQDGMYWSAFGIPLADAPDATPVVAHEAIAQYYTFKLLQQLKDTRLIDTFLTLEQSCSDVYRAWRATEHYSLEQMREVLMKCRQSVGQWPPA